MRTASMTDVHPCTRVPKNTWLMNTYAPKTKLSADTASPRNEIVRIGSDEKEINVSSAAFSMRRTVHDDDPTRRRGRWYGTFVSRNPLQANRPNVSRLRSLRCRNASLTGRGMREI